MTDKPMALTAKEIKEVAAIQDIQDMWGAENAKEMEETLKGVYMAKFHFTEECPGYSGVLMLIHPAVLDSDAPAIRLIRIGGKLEVFE